MRFFWLIYGLTATLLIGSLANIFLRLPIEKTQGVVQKIFFFHVPSAFAMYLFLSLGALFSVVYLIQRNVTYDSAAKASMLVASLFGALVMVSGPLWAKPVWGVYWAWDPRLTTSFIVFMLLIAYLVTRKVFDDREGGTTKGAFVGAILAVVACLNIPLIHYSVRIWRGLHPSVLRDPEGLPPVYRNAFETMIFAIFLFGFLLAILAFWIYQTQKRVHALRRNFLQERSEDSL
ncbi:MAG: hypothetical protein EA369_08780 [Bradymonadales bacterium]|nr:MAG: hypothetical protein EA369_08780 [Bradymonadales bacterium]